jgi:hypothetical protein
MIVVSHAIPTFEDDAKALLAGIEAMPDCPKGTASKLEHFATFRGDPDLLMTYLRDGPAAAKMAAATLEATNRSQRQVVIDAAAAILKHRVLALASAPGRRNVAYVN